MICTMKNTIRVSIDGAGRFVVPKAIRERAGIVAGDALVVTYRDGRIEIEPAPREVRIERREGFRVAEPRGGHETLEEETVRRTREDVREVRKGGRTRR